MEEKKIKRVTMAIFLILCTGIFFVVFEKTPPLIEKNTIKAAAFISYASASNYRQTPNDCGPYSTAAVVRAIKKEEIDSSNFAKKIQWRLPKKGTLPWGLENQLKEYDIVIEKPYLRLFSDEEKILFLRQQLSLEKPVIILGEKNNFQHYITIFGFDTAKDEFYVYDSLHEKNPDDMKLTIDNNGHLPGNKILSTKGLIDFWQNGGMYGIYKWYALVASG